MAKETNCPKCGSNDVIPDVRILDAFGTGPEAKQSLQVEVHENPGAWLFKGTQRNALRANICGQCGFAELYVKDAHELLDAYRKQRVDQ